MDQEVWRRVPSVPTLEASSYGRVRILPYEQKMPHGGVRTRVGEARFGDWAEDCKRFLFVHKRKTYKVHQLVCEAFNGEKPFEGAVVMHDDEDSRNNRPENLIWGTQKENLNYKGFLEKRSALTKAYFQGVRVSR